LFSPENFSDNDCNAFVITIAQHRAAIRPFFDFIPRTATLRLSAFLVAGEPTLPLTQGS
jgi:hypothetical protein